MKEIKFHKIKVKNFLSIGDEGIEIDFTEGLNIITGINKDKEDSKNGVGKSAIADSIFFSIFGTPLRDIKIENIPNWKTNRQCEVSIEFTVVDNYTENKYRIERTLNPSRVVLFENNENISRTVSKTNAKIKKIIGTTPEMFEQSVVMSINQTEPFLQKRPAIKRKFIEGIFKLTIFSEMLSIIRHDLHETKRKLNIEKATISEIQKSLIVYKQQQENQNNKKIERINELERRRISNTNEIQELNKALKTIDIKAKDVLQQKIDELTLKEVQYENQLRDLLQDNSAAQTGILTLTEKIDEINNYGTDICITCKRPFKEEDIQQHISSKQIINENIKELNKKITNINKNIKQIDELKQLCRTNITTMIQEKHDIDLKQIEIENIKHRIFQCNEFNQQIKIDIEQQQNEKDTYNDIIINTKQRLKVLTEKQNNFQLKLDTLDISKFVVSDEGVRSFIVKKMLKMLNNRLNYYLKKLDANCLCTFNEYFEESIYNEKGRLCSYFNFSGGERKRIDLAMLFTFLDIRRLQSNVSLNISIYDELLDSSLDSKGIEGVLDILKERISIYKESIYIISHKNEAIKHATGNIIYLEKQNEITRRLQYGTTI